MRKLIEHILKDAEESKMIKDLMPKSGREKRRERRKKERQKFA